MRNRVLFVALAALVSGAAGLLMVDTEAAAHRPDREKPSCPGGFTYEAGIGCAKRLPNGNLLVHDRRGQRSEVHGGDPTEAMAELGEGELRAERHPVCAAEPRVEVVYAYKAGSANRVADVRDIIRGYVRTINGQLHSEALESGGPGADLRVECDSSGAPSVAVVAVSGDGTYSDVTAALGDTGRNRSTEKYVVFADWTSPDGYSGVGTFYHDDRLVADNANLVNAGWGITYSGAWAQSTPFHELGHNLGAVQFSAPDSSGAGHCDGYTSQDVMCYPDGGDRWDETHACGAVTGQHFDACHNDYFDTAPEGGEYLGERWNLGVNTSWAGFANRFLAFGAAPPPPPSTTTTTTTVPPSTTTTTTAVPPPPCWIKLWGRCV